MRPLHVWIAFAACVAVVLAAMGWVSANVLRLDAAEIAARRQAVIEENVRLALWRMDSALAPVIARESTWPYFAYNPFYPAQRAYTSMFNPIRQGEVLMPSPLLNQPSPDVLLHFLIGPDNAFTSPQVPTGKMRELAENGFTTAEAIRQAARRLEVLQNTVNRAVLLSRLDAPHTSPVRTAMLPSEPGQNRAQQVGVASNAPAQRAAQPGPNDQNSQFELPQRSARQQQQLAMNQSITEQQAYQAPQPGPARSQRQSAKSANEANARAANFLGNSLSVYGGNNDMLIAQQPISDVHEGLSRPIWLGDQLVLARRVLVGNVEYVQGCWLDWPGVQRRLVREIGDLLPEGRLEPIRNGTGDSQGRVLAALPVLLVAGSLPAPADARASPLRLSLAVAWVGLLLAATAVAVLLAMSVSLSERRGAFVSAVTHEMRTPLTTFRMYTEMLVKDMVPGERRVKYLDTLRIEADRLAHLVENVLAYARLERGRSASRLEPTTVAAIIERVQQRLADRAEQAGMHLDVQANGHADAGLNADPTAVEQVLFNLVDNACKYAAAASDRTIHLRTDAADGHVTFEVCDHGPGVSAEQRARLFRPFSKSAQQAAHSAPGVGLGLALSRRLARKMGGDLRLGSGEKLGAAFVLSLPQHCVPQRWGSEK